MYRYCRIYFSPHKKGKTYKLEIGNYANILSLYKNDKEIYESKLFYYQKELNTNSDKIKKLISQYKSYQKEISALTTKIDNPPKNYV